MLGTDHKSRHHESAKKESESSSFQAQSDSGSGISHENSECVRREKIQRLKKKKRRIYSTKAKGNWNLEQDIRFMTFMMDNRQSFENRDLRRSNKIFKKMARSIRTRCPEQCRSHHQKYQKKYTYFDNIVTFISNKARRAQSRTVKSEANFPDSQPHPSIQPQPHQSPNPRKLKTKKEKPTIAPPSSTDFSLLKQQQGYNIMVAYDPTLHIQIQINLSNIGGYGYGH